MKYQEEEEGHMKAASNRLSYHKNAMGQHNSEYQHNCKPYLEASILDNDTQQHSTKRKLSEAVNIHTNRSILDFTINRN